MPQTTIFLSLVLVCLGVGMYFGTGQKSVTALIPAAFGVVLLLAGLAALKPALRKHAMHLAAVVALLGIVGALGRPLRILATTGSVTLGPPLYSQLAMAAVCTLLLILAIKSFVDARLRRKAAASQPD